MDIILFGGIDWTDSRRFPVHHTAERLADRGHRIFYVDNFGGIRDLQWGDVERAFSKVKAALLRRTSGNESGYSHQNIWVYQPLIVPSPRLPNTVGRLNGSLIARGVNKLIRKHDVRNPIVWTRVATHISWFAIRRIEPALLIYQVVDNFPTNPILTNSLKQQHQQYVGRFSRSADLIFASARGLKEQRERVNDNVHFFPNGVEVEKFERGNASNASNLADIPEPRIGFVGTIQSPVDFSVLEEAARRKSEWSFVFIGPVTEFAELGELPDLENVHFIGPVDHDVLPAYCQALDLGLIPYEFTEFTKYTFPSKLAEYLASGTPVLSSDIPEMRHYEETIGIYGNVEEFIEEAQHQMQKQDSKAKKDRREVARELSWDQIVERMSETMARALANES
jgi:glycosyltransferase involved in cell wall biosynthesis